MIDKRDNFDEILKKRYDDFHADTPAWNELFSERELAKIHPHNRFLYRRSLLVISSVAALIIVGIILNITFPNKNSNQIEQTSITLAKIDPEIDKTGANLNTSIITIAKEDTKKRVQHNQITSDTAKFAVVISDNQPIIGSDASVNEPDDHKTTTKDSEQNNRRIWNGKELTKRRKGKLSLLATTSLTSSIGASQLSSVMPMYDSPIAVDINNYRSSINFEKADYNHKFPINVALLVRYEVANRLLISGGINYCYLESSAQKIEKLSYSIKQRVNYLGIPVALNYDFLMAKRFSVYGLIGGMVEFNVGSNNEINSYSKENLIKTQKEKIIIKTPLFSLQGGIGLRYNIVDSFGIFVEPGINYVFNNDLHPISYKTNSSMQFNFKVGFSVDL